MQAVSDEQLIRWVAEGDASCLGTLFERHHRAVYRYCLQMTHSKSMSEDLVQEVFIRLLRHAGSFRAEGSGKAWIFHIARNVAFDSLRKTGEELGHTEREDESPHEQLIDHRSSEQVAAGHQNLQLVERALSQISPAAREVIWLGRFVFDDYEELARALGCNAGAARVRMHRAMEALQATFLKMTGAPIDV